MFQKTFAVLAASIVVLCTSQIASAQVTATIDPTGSVCNGVPCSTSQTQTFSFRIVNGNTASFSMLSVIIAPPSDLNLDACYFLYGRWGNSGRGSLAIFLDSPQANNGNP